MKRFSLIGVLTLCFIAAQICHAANIREEQIKAQMIENSLLWQEALRLRDAERIISFESPDFMGITHDKHTFSKSEIDGLWREAMMRFQKVHHAKVAIKKLTIEPNRVVVLSTQYIEGAQSLRDGHLHHVIYDSTSRGIWVNYDGIWMLKRMEELKLRVVIDGKTVFT